MKPPNRTLFLPIDFTIFKLDRLEHFPPQLRVSQAKYYYGNEIIHRKIRPREPLMPEELVQKRLNERLLEKCPYLEDFLQQLCQDLEQYPVFVTYTSDAADILASTTFDAIYLTPYVIGASTGLVFGHELAYSQILSVLEMTLQSKVQNTQPIALRQVEFEEIKVQYLPEKQRLEQTKRVDPPQQVDAILTVSNIVQLLAREDRFNQKFLQVVFHVTNRLLFTQKFEEKQNHVIHIQTRRMIPADELIHKFGIPQIDILDVRHCFPCDTYVKLNQKANSDEILQKMRQEFKIKPQLDKGFPPMPTDILIEVKSDNIEEMKKINHSLYKIIINDSAQLLEIEKYVYENKKFSRGPVRRFLHFQMVTGRDQWRQVMQDGIILTSKDEWDLLKSLCRVREIQLNEDVRSPMITVHSIQQWCKQIVCVKIDIDAHIKEITNLLKDTGTTQLLAWQFHSPFSAGQGPIKIFQGYAVLMTQDQDAANTMIRQLADRQFRRRPLMPEIVQDAQSRECVRSYTQIIYLQNVPRPVYLLQYKSRQEPFQFDGQVNVKAGMDIFQAQFKDEESANQAAQHLRSKGFQEFLRINYD